MIDRFTRAGWSVTITPGHEPWAIRVGVWRMDGTGPAMLTANTTPRELLYASADPDAVIIDALREIAREIGVDVAAPRG